MKDHKSINLISYRLSKLSELMSECQKRKSQAQKVLLTLNAQLTRLNERALFTDDD